MDTHLNSPDPVFLPAVIVHNGHIVVADVQLLPVAVRVRVFGWHQGSHMKQH